MEDPAFSIMNKIKIQGTRCFNEFIDEIQAFFGKKAFYFFHGI
jgi:hypothetical protein